MILKERINEDYILAFKEKRTIDKNLLSVIKGEIQTQEKILNIENLSDADVAKILSKITKSINETIEVLSKVGGDPLNKAISELSILQPYLPKKMSREEIAEKVSVLISSGISNIGSIMKEFANLPADKKIVSELIKEIMK